MKFLYSLTGANVPVIKEFDTYNTEKIEKGDVLFLDIGKKATKSNSGNVLGVSAETHSGKEDILNERSNKDKIRVDITAGGVYSVAPLLLTAVQDGSTGSFFCSDENVDYSVEGFKLVLVEKAEGSENTDNIGDVRNVSFGSPEEGKINMSISAGGKTCKGDVYAMYPAVGTEGYYNENGGNFIITNGTGICIVAVGANIEKGYVEVKLSHTAFEN